MVDYEKYRDIAPYQGEDVRAAVERISKHPELLYAFACAIYKGEGAEVESQRMGLVKYVLEVLKTVGSYDDFQHKITSALLLKNVIDRSMQSFTVSGAEKIDPSKSYLFISNHRDIVLDCALLDYALYERELPLCEMAIGDNLLKHQFLLDLFKLNGAIIVKRDLPMREKYIETVRLSEYFYSTLQGGKNIWIAQKSGRSKDGLDMTHPAIIKMLYLGPKKDKISFAEVIKNCHIMPVAISYEDDPNAINNDYEGTLEKARTLLKAAGYKFGDDGMLSAETPISLEYLTNEATSHVKIAEAIQQDLAAVGIDMTIKQCDWNVFLQERKNGNFDFAREGWIADFNDPINMLEMWITESGNNDCQYGR